MNSLGGRLYRFRLFVARNTIPMVWIWAGTMLCGLGTVYYRLRKGEDITSEQNENVTSASERARITLRFRNAFSVSLQDIHMHPNPETLHTIHGWIKKLGLDQVRRTEHSISITPNSLLTHRLPITPRKDSKTVALEDHFENCFRILDSVWKLRCFSLSPSHK